jgi:hypothetical protein
MTHSELSERYLINETSSSSIHRPLSLNDRENRRIHRRARFWRVLVTAFIVPDATSLSLSDRQLTSYLAVLYSIVEVHYSKKPCRRVRNFAEEAAKAKQKDDALCSRLAGHGKFRVRLLLARREPAVL